MEKREIQYVVLALSVVIILALVVKPALTGRPANLGVQATGNDTPLPTETAGTVPTPAGLPSASPGATTTTETVAGVPPPVPSDLPYAVREGEASLPAGSTPIAIPSSAPASAGTVAPVRTPAPTVAAPLSGVTQIPFVDPARYSVQLTDPLPPSIPLVTSPTEDPTMQTYAQVSGRWSGTTDVIQIPYPSFEIEYTLTPSVQPDIVMPRFSIQVVDADDPNRFVRIISPPGNTFSGRFSEKFYEGNHRYYFVITSRYIQSYTIHVKVPRRYL
ncbi:MAG TPA: hypothetical protein PK089_01790 [Methanoregulaceae archaeon]|nr:hypothetical protein [Methanoregulaceae archaeon]HQJ88519.1 hypothetical protein [Methanoregulaceae archaeon]